MIKKETDDLTICFEPSPVRNIKDLQEILFMDKLYMKNKDVWIVTKADADRIELMLQSRKMLDKSNLLKFIKDLQFIKRAECWENNG